ncbi:MAG TPA: hypothetical protein PKA63_00015 [Oligoflexia bacterium]|nr:hypothetical protein [Oligoflexia bacterium]HMP47032.1 hypothetical protein [Oligoflexia bacterium]
MLKKSPNLTLITQTRALKSRCKPLAYNLKIVLNSDLRIFSSFSWNLLFSSVLFISTLTVSACDWINSRSNPENSNLGRIESIIDTQTNPNLRKNEELIKEDLSDKEIEKILNNAKKNPHLKHWAELLKGKILINQNKLDESFQILGSIPDNTPAFQDASLLLIQNKLNGKTPDLSKLDRDLNLLEATLEPVDKLVLNPDIRLTRGLIAEKKREYRDALSIYYNIRIQNPDTNAAWISHQRVRELTKEDGALPSGISLAEQLAEASILIRENKITESYNLLQDSLKLVQRDTPAFYEIRETEIALLEKSGRFESAKQLLDEIISNAPPLISSRALLKKINGSINSEDKDSNNEKHILSLIKYFKNRFHESPIYPEILFIEAEILSRRGLFPDSKILLQEIIARGSPIELVLKADRALAWNHLRTGNYQASEDQFSNLSQKASDILQLIQFDTDNYMILESYLSSSKRQAPRSRASISEDSIIESIINELFDYRSHGDFWKAATRKLRGKSKKWDHEILSNITESNPLGYYTEMSLNYLNSDDNFKKTFSSSCKIKDEEVKTPDDINEKLRSLKQAGLINSMTREAWWSIGLSGRNYSEITPLLAANVISESGETREARKILRLFLPAWRFSKIIDTDQNPMNCKSLYIKTASAFIDDNLGEEVRTLINNIKNPDERNMLSALLINHIDNSPDLNKEESLKALKKAQTFFSKYSSPEEVILAYLKSPEWLESEPAYLRKNELPSDLPSGTWLEMLSDSVIREQAKEILLIKFWLDAGGVKLLNSSQVI